MTGADTAAAALAAGPRAWPAVASAAELPGATRSTRSPRGQRAAVQVDAHLVAVGVTDPEGLGAQPA